MEFDFGGYATRYGIRCTDNRTIAPRAFEDCNGETVPIVWEHDHSSPDNVLGKAMLEHRDDGVYVWGIFNDTDLGQKTKELIRHGDLNKLSIYANHIKQIKDTVIHGAIKEVSIVYAGANAGAYIDTVSMAHSDSDDYEEAIIYSGDEIDADISHSDSKKGNGSMPNKEKTIQEILDTMNEDQLNLLYYLVDKAMNEKNDSDEKDDNEVEHSDGGDDMKWNAFAGTDDTATISHADEFFANETADIFSDAKRCGSLRDSIIAHADSYGINDISVLFPDAHLIGEPKTIDRRQEWVKSFMDKTSKSPFGKIKSIFFDITADEARAKGYVKGKKKVDEVIQALKRTTEQTTVYKKQRFDRDDLIDITDFNTVGYIMNEMRGKLDEELARAALIGDGRSAVSDDKIDETKIRPIYSENDLFMTRVAIDVSASDTDATKAANIIDALIKSRKLYKGSGNATFYTTEDVVSMVLTLKDTQGHYIYKSIEDFARVIRASEVETVEIMEGVSRKDGNTNYDLVGIFVNPADYTFGATNGGKVTAFDDFDIDYNQQKYLIETRCCGALTVPYSALVFEFKSTAAAG